MTELTVTVHGSGFTGERESFERPRVLLTDALLIPSSFDCLVLIILLLLVMVGMWLTGSVRDGGEDVEIVPVAVVRTTTYANLQQKEKI